MPFVEVSDGSLRYRVDGAAAAPVLVLSNSLGTDLAMWDRQVAALSRSFRILRYDTRGHGASLVSPGPYTIELLARDVLSMLDRLEIERVHFCGLSLGGMAGIWLAANEPARVDKLVLANTTAYAAPASAWDARIAAVRERGMAGISEAVVQRWFTPAFCQRSPAAVAAVRNTLLATSPQAYIASCEAIRDMDQRGSLSSIRTQSLVIAGTDDPATPPTMCRTLAEAIDGARWLELPAAHLSNIEAAEAFDEAVAEFLLC